MSVSKTTDSGSNWLRYDIATYAGRTQALVIDPGNSSIIYAGGDENSNAVVYKSTNGGGSWSELAATGLVGEDVLCLALDSDDTDILYAGTNTNLYKSTDGGSTFSSTNCPGGWTNAVLVNRSSPIYEGIYAGTEGNGVYYSSDNGSSWMPINEGLDDFDINCLGISQGTYIYAGTQNSGLYRWSIEVGSNEHDIIQPEHRKLFAVPNPISSKATIHYYVEGETWVNLRIYDIQGRHIRTLVNEQKQSGYYTVLWDGCDQQNRKLTSGVYLYRLDTATYSAINKIIILK